MDKNTGLLVSSFLKVYDIISTYVGNKYTYIKKEIKASLITASHKIIKEVKADKILVIRTDLRLYEAIKTRVSVSKVQYKIERHQ